MLRTAFFALALVALGLSGCSSCGKSDTLSVDASVEALVEPPVPAPASLLAHGVVGTPTATWSRIQTGVGGAVGILPPTVGGMICSLAGIDLALGSEIDGTAPGYVVLGGELQDPSWVLAVKVVEQRKARSALLEGETSKYMPREDGSLTYLSPKGGAPSVGLALTRSAFLLVGKSEEAVRELGPYAYRTLPAAAPPSSAAVVEVAPMALSGPLRASLERLWQGFAVSLLAADARMREERGGRSPDFGDPKAIVATADALVQRRLATLGGLSKLQVFLDVGEDNMHLRAEAAPGEGLDKGLAPMTVGPVSPLLDAPVDSIATIISRSAAEERESDARDVEAALVGALGKRLTDAESKRVHSVIEDFARGRGDALVISALGGEKAKGLVLRADARSGEVLGRSLSGLTELLRAPLLKEPLRLKEVQKATGEAPGVGKCEVTTLMVQGKGKLPDTRLGFAWTVEDGKLTAALGDLPLELVARGARPGRKLSDEKAFSSYLEALGGEASFALFAQPFLVDQSKPVPPSPLVLAWGKKASGLWLRLDVADRVVREIAKKQLGF